MKVLIDRRNEIPKVFILQTSKGEDIQIVAWNIFLKAFHAAPLALLINE
jgi:hypothetical protein